MNTPDHMSYLIAAYSAIWILIAFFLFVLMMRNRRLLNQVKELEDRLQDLENKREGGSRE